MGNHLLQPVTLDLRSLALLRLATALLFAGYIGIQLADATASFRHTPEPVLVAVLILGIPIALLLAVGYRSRLMAMLGCAVILGDALSPAGSPTTALALDAGPMVLAFLLLLGAVLPLGTRYSLDSAVNTAPPPHNRHRSLATAALVLGFVVINLGPTLLPPSHPLAGPAASPDRQTANQATSRETTEPSTPIPPLMPRTLTASHLTPLPWLPPAILHTINVAVLAGLLCLLLPLAQTLLRGIAAITLPILHLLLATDIQSPLLALSLAATWLAVIPPGLWELLFRHLRTPSRLGLTIWYHGSDPSHIRRIRLLTTFLLIPETPLRPSHESVDIDVYRRQRDSWVVTDHEGYRYNRFRAFAIICRHSPLAFPLAPLLRTSVVETVGDWFYDFGKRHRGPLTRLANALSFRITRPHIPWWQQTLALAALAAITAWSWPH